MTILPPLILDLGGVIFDIDYRLTIDAFQKLGLPDADQMYSQSAQTALFDSLEKGLIEEKEFFQKIRSISTTNPDDDSIRAAWNALLIGVPDENYKFLYELKKKYRLFLLSNTNSIHEAAYREMISAKFGSFFFDEIFENMYLSHRIHMRKPEVEIFEYVLRECQLDPSETLFYDDSIQHIEGAKKAGIKSYLFPKHKFLNDIIAI